MFKIDPNALYSKNDLSVHLEGLTDVDRFLARIHPKCVIMGMYLGFDMIDALRAAPDYRELKKSSKHSVRVGRTDSRSKKHDGSKPKPTLAHLISPDEVSA